MLILDLESENIDLCKVVLALLAYDSLQSKSGMIPLTIRNIKGNLNYSIIRKRNYILFKQEKIWIIVMWPNRYKCYYWIWLM